MMPSDSTHCETPATVNGHEAKPLSKRTKPLPDLDFSGGDDECKGGRGSRQGSQGGEEKGHVSQKLNPEHREADEQKWSASRRSLMQLFVGFNISDDDDEDRAPAHHRASDERVFHWDSSSRHETRQQQQEQQRRQQPPTGNPARTRTSMTVTCPCCGRGSFSVQLMSGVMCPLCRTQFVPAGIGMMAAERHAARRKKETTSRTKLCACGKARKGLCFLCD